MNTSPFARVAVVAILLVGSSAVAAAGDAPGASEQDLRWRLLGPLRAGWSTCVTGVPDALDTFYFCAADGGVWKTQDSGMTWEPIADRAPFSSVGAIAVVPDAESGRRTIVVGSGQVQTRYDVMDGTGVWKSEDEGRSWISLGLSDSRHIGRIWVDPRDPKVLLVAALGHLYGPNEERGVFRSADGGASWTRVAFVDRDTGAVDLAADPAVPDVVYAAFWQVRRYPWQGYHVPQSGPGSGIWKSTDAGRTWAPAGRSGLPPAPLGRIGLAVAPGTSGRRVYAVVEAGRDTGLYRSDDGGATWILAQKNRALASSYAGYVFADPRHADRVYFVGQSFRRSDDGGRTVVTVKGSPGGDDYHFLWINPKHPERMALASDQGTTVSVNGGLTWSPWYNQATGQFYRLGADDGFPYKVYSGQQDSGTVAVPIRSDEGQLTYRSWHSVGGDERDGDLPDPTDPGIVFGSGLGGKLSRWDAATKRVANVSPWPISSYGQRPPDTPNRTTWITPIAIDPRPPHALFQATQKLHRSTDRGQTWAEVSPDLTGATGEGCHGEPPIERASACGFGVIFAIAPSPVASGTIWIGTDNGRIQVTKDGGSTWRDVTPRDLPDWSQVAAIDASPTDAGTAYAAIDRHRLDDRSPWILATHDAGATWRRIDAGLPRDAWVNVVRQDPVRPGLLYAGTRTGVFVSFDDGGSWRPVASGLPTTGVNDLLVKGSDLVAATQGRALWVLDDLTPLRAFGGAVGSTPQLAAPAPAVRVADSENRDTPLPPEFPTTPNPPAGAVLDYLLPAAPSGPVRIEIRDGAGALVRAFSSADRPERAPARQYFADRWLQPLPVPGAKPGHNRFVWDLRAPQPKATDYDFSIAAVPGRDTPTVPQGPFVLPGRYTVRLVVDGAVLEQPLDVVADPRSRATRAELSAQWTLEQQVIATLGKVVDALAAAESLAGQLAPIASAKPGIPKKSAARARELGAALAKLTGGGGDTDLATIGAVLSGLEGDLEGADGPPTAVQRQIADAMRDRVEKALDAWKALDAAARKDLGKLLPKATPGSAGTAMQRGGGVDRE